MDIKNVISNRFFTEWAICCSYYIWNKALIEILPQSRNMTSKWNNCGGRVLLIWEAVFYCCLLYKKGWILWKNDGHFRLEDNVCRKTKTDLAIAYFTVEVENTINQDVFSNWKPQSHILSLNSERKVELL